AVATMASHAVSLHDALPIFPPGVINLLTGDDADLGDALVDHPRTRFITFTGSVATGLRIHERAAKVQPGQFWLKRVFLEMGGKEERKSTRLNSSHVKSSYAV